MELKGGGGVEGRDRGSKGGRIKGRRVKGREG